MSDVTKLTNFLVLGPQPDQVEVKKLVLYVVLGAGDGGPAGVHQGQAYSQVLRRSDDCCSRSPY